MTPSSASRSFRLALVPVSFALYGCAPGPSMYATYAGYLNDQSAPRVTVYLANQVPSLVVVIPYAGMATPHRIFRGGTVGTVTIVDVATGETVFSERRAMRHENRYTMKVEGLGESQV